MKICCKNRPKIVDEFEYEDLDILDDTTIPEISEKRGVFKYVFPLQFIFAWLYGLVWKGFHSTLTIKDLPRLSKEYLSTTYVERFERMWKFFSWGNKVRLALTLYTCFGVEYALSGLMRLFTTIISQFIPLFLKFYLQGLGPLITDAKRTEMDNLKHILPPELHPPSDLREIGYRNENYTIWLWLFAMIGTQIVIFVVQTYSYFLASKVGTKMRVLLINRIYGKIFRLTNEGRARKNEIMTFLAFDTYMIDDGHHQFHETWTAMIQVFVSAYFLVELLGPISLTSYAALCVVILLMFAAMACLLLFRVRILSFVDRRIEVMKEVLQNSILVKFFNLQAVYLKKILKVRAKEIANFRIMFVFQSIISSLSYTGPALMTMLCFVFFYVQSGKFDLVKLLVSLSYFKMLQVPLGAISLNLTQYVHAMAAMIRVQNFLEEPEDDAKGFPKPSDSDVAIEIKNGSFHWPGTTSSSSSSSIPEEEERDETESGSKGRKEMYVELENSQPVFALSGINLSIKKGQFVLVVGKTHSGKTSLIKSLLGETNRSTSESEVKIDGNFSFCDQDVFLENETILENITLGAKDSIGIDEERLLQVLDVCGLNKDIATLYGGLSLQIGDNSCTLSSGQKSRIALARACYHGSSEASDIYLLDNVLSTLDSFVSHHVLQSCILRFLKGKTRILVTNKTEIFPYADLILFMENGQIIERGNYQELLAQEGKFYEFVGKTKFEKVDEYEPIIQSHEIKIEQNMKRRVISTEERRAGRVRWSTLCTYIRFSSIFCSSKSSLFGVLSLLLVLLLYIACILTYFFSELHVSNVCENSLYMKVEGNFYTTTFTTNMTTQESSYYDVGQKFSMNKYDPQSWCPYNDSSSLECGYRVVEVFWDPNFKNGTLLANGMGPTGGLVMYGVIVLLLFIALLTAPICFFNVFLSTSNRMFKRSLNSLLNTSMKFFYANPIGRLVNRLSHDVSRMDFDLLVRGEFLLTISLLVFGSFVLVIYSSVGIFAPFMIIGVGLLIFVFALFRKITIELKRIEAITKSNVFSVFTQTLNGLSTLSAFKLQAKFRKKCDKHVNINNTPSFLLYAAKYSLQLYLTLFGAVTVLFVGALSIPISHYLSHIINSNYLKVGLVNLITSLEVFGTTFYQLVLWEIELNSVERLDYYIQKVKCEEKQNSIPIDIKEGSVEFENFSLRYKEGFPLVLNNINAKINPGENIVIIGRTGCGKSSLLLSTIRILHGCEGGSVLIDGQNINSVSVSSLRAQISIVPADPTLFSGTIRENFDPFERITDDVIMETMELCHLTKIIENHGGLHAKIEENGRNFSIGERRLIILCRALLRKPKVLLLDECTSIDYNLDELIQKIVVKLEQVTVISVSHRLNNIAFYDKVLVLNEGCIQEFDEPKKLIVDETSHLRKLVELIPNRNEMLSLFHQ